MNTTYGSRASQAAKQPDNMIAVASAAEIPTNFHDLKLETLKPIPLNVGGLALALSKEGDGVLSVELLTDSGPVRKWTLKHGEKSNHDVAVFTYDSTKCEAIKIGASLTLDLTADDVIGRARGALCTLFPKLAPTHSKACISIIDLKPSEKQVGGLRANVSLNNEIPIVVAL